MQKSRRVFLKRSLTAGTAISLPYLWIPTDVHGGANEIPTVAAIGLGGSRAQHSRGATIAKQAALLGNLVAICDVDDVHNQEFNKEFNGTLKTYTDYRKLLEEIKPDVVTIGTPDHWHVPISIAALQAGANVYCEKPLTLTIDEGFHIRKAVKETKKVFQVGSQQRSEFNSLFLKAVAIVKSGRLGKNVKAHVAVSSSPKGGPFNTEKIPKGLNWDMWLGPAPMADYCEQRRKEFRWWFDYSGGKITDWGAHHIDIAQWALGHEYSGPVRIGGNGCFPPLVPNNFNWDAYLDGKEKLPNGYNTAVEFHIDLTFNDGSIITVDDHYKRESEGIFFGNGILFEGDEGRIFVNRHKLQGKPFEEMTVAEKKALDEKVVELYGGQPNGHMQNFFNCVKTRQNPISDVVTHVRTITSCHLCNLSLMLGRDLQWDPAKEKFVGDDQAAALTARSQRPCYMP